MAETGEHDSLILEIRDRFKAAKGAWQKIAEQGDIDMRYVAGDPWEKKDRRAREAAKRPVLALDELSQYFNQTINDVRANPRAMKFTPRGNGATDASAKFYQDKARDTEYQSHAQLGYVTAYENCIQRSYGWTRYLTKYTHDVIPEDAEADPRFFYQDIWIEPVANPNMVLPDPMWTRPEISDISYLFFTEPWRTSEFKAEFGDQASRTDFGADWVYRESLQDWINTEKDQVLVSEYWKRERHGRRRLVQLKPNAQQGSGKTFWWPGANDSHHTIATQLKIKADQIHDSRTVDDYRVTCYLTNGVDILKTQPWRGRYIPFSACTGKIIYVDRGSGPQREILSMTRLARDPYMLYCYIRTLEMETMGMITKFPYFFYEGQLSPEMLKKLADSLHKPVAGIAVKAFIQGLNPGTLLPFPQRNLLAPDLQAYEIFAEAARRAIQAAMGISPMPTAALRRNEKSGVALKEMNRQEQLGSFHFASHYDDMIRHGGIIYEDLLDKIYDTARDVSTRDEFEEAQTIRINDPEGSVYKRGRLSGEPVWTKGDHLVTVSSGPGQETQREELAETFTQFSTDPNVMARAGDIIVRLVGKTRTIDPLIDQLADRLKPPDVKQQEMQEAQGEPDPQQLMMQLTQAKQQQQQAEQAIAQLTMEIKTREREFEQQRITKKMELDAKASLETSLKRMDLDERERERAAKIAVARITAAKGALDTAAEAREEAIALEHEADQAALDRQHELHKSHVDHVATLIEQEQAHTHATAQAEQAHEQALEQGQQGIEGDLRTQAQQAVLSPPTANGDGGGA